MRLVREKQKSPILIVCPTSTGGHIEHAANLANGFENAFGRQVILVSRKGARDYLSRKIGNHVVLLEKIPSLIHPSIPNPIRLVLQVATLMIEFAQVYLLAIKKRPSFIILEEPRFGPLAALLPTKRVLFFHNIPETLPSKNTRGIRDVISLLTARNCNLTVVHGSHQLDQLMQLLPKVKGMSVVLPGIDSWRKRNLATRKATGKEFLCIGEIRASKGLELAIKGARKSRKNLRIVGRSTDTAYFEALKALSENSKTITLENRFLTSDEFEELIRSAYCLLLPYLDFQAQSGVLSKALAYGVPVICTDLPSLREQSSGSQTVHFFEPGDYNSLAEIMKKFNWKPSPGIDVQTWDSVAITIGKRLGFQDEK